MSFTLTETGKFLTETREGVTMPADYSFECVNDFVHRWDTHYEDLQYLCIGMATHIEKLQRGEFICKKCGLRKDSEHDCIPEF
ncbi:MAG: hypothetical protein Q8M07_02645 [Prosthecobacter sp.]|nr:hypothetical protein [Prosthecobacter sp.]